MPPTLVNVAVGVLLGCALLGAAFDRRSIAIVAAAAALPDADVLLEPLLPGATNAAFHTLLIPTVVTLLLYWETNRQQSWLRERWGAYGVRVAWVALASYLVAGIGLDLFTVEGVALLFPLSDAVYGISGKFVLSTQEGVVVTYLRPESDGALPLWYLGEVPDHRVDSWLSPTDGERRLRLVDFGYHLVIVVSAAATLIARFVVERRWPPEGR